jgi:hypothetical protein
VIRVTEHTARKPGVCAPCRREYGPHACEIRPGDRYRQLVAVGETDIFESGYVRTVACLLHFGEEAWELRDDRRPRDPGDPLCAYVREHYGLQVERGTRVIANGKPGTVRGATHHVWVRLDGERHAAPYHPGDVQIAPEPCPFEHPATCLTPGGCVGMCQQPNPRSL